MSIKDISDELIRIAYSEREDRYALVKKIKSNLEFIPANELQQNEKELISNILDEILAENSEKLVKKETEIVVNEPEIIVDENPIIETNETSETNETNETKETKETKKVEKVDSEDIEKIVKGELSFLDDIF